MQRFRLVMFDRLPPIDAFAVKSLIVDAARERGFGDVRIAPAFPDERSRSRMAESFQRGDLATWKYGDEYARAASDPSHILQGAKSVICMAVPYATPPARRTHLQGRVSNYAWSSDYHHRIKALLAEIAGIIDDAAGANVTAIACDTKPIAERAFAAQSGLGWIGKHTSLISPTLGSYVFLGEIVTTLDLPVDAPVRKTCGACTRCVSACPTSALRGDYTIDATRCIADLTQRTDPIPREMRSLIGDWVWGCDLCQDVCPPTQRAGQRGAEAFRAYDDVAQAPSLLALLELRSGEFKRRFAKTAMGWRGAAVLRRNAAIALGNALDRGAIPALGRALDGDPHAMVRGAAAWALGRIGGLEAMKRLERRLALEEDESVQEEISCALSS